MSASSMHKADYSKPVLWDNQEGWGEEGGKRAIQDVGTHVHLWLIHVKVWHKSPQYYNYLPIKIYRLITPPKKRAKICIAHQCTEHYQACSLLRTEKIKFHSKFTDLSPLPLKSVQ